MNSVIQILQQNLPELKAKYPFAIAWVVWFLQPPIW